MNTDTEDRTEQRLSELPDKSSAVLFDHLPPSRRRGMMLPIIATGIAALIIGLILPGLIGATLSPGLQTQPSTPEAWAQSSAPAAPRVAAPASGQTGQVEPTAGGTSSPGNGSDGAIDPKDRGNNQPQPPVDPDSGPEEPAPPAPAKLDAAPDPVILKPAVYSGSFNVSNLGDESMQWSASTVFYVSLSDTSGDLSGGGGNVINFTVDKAGVKDGGFAFKIKVTGNGGTQYVDVKGFKPFGNLAP
jgi:hypothetical protein